MPVSLMPQAIEPYRIEECDACVTLLENTPG